MNIIIFIDETKPEINGQPKYFCIPSNAYPHNHEPRMGDMIGLRINEFRAKDDRAREYSFSVQGLYAVELVAEGPTHLNFPESFTHELENILPNSEICHRVTIRRITNVNDSIFDDKRVTPIETCVYFQ